MRGGAAMPAAVVGVPAPGSGPVPTGVEGPVPSTVEGPLAAGNPTGGNGGRGCGVPADAAVPTAAGIFDEGRGAEEDAVFATRLGGADGASIAITSQEPANPMTTAAAAYALSRPGETLRLPGGRE